MLIWVKIKVPKVNLPPFLVPVFAVTGLVECLEDLTALGAWIAPNAVFGNQKLRFSEIRDIIRTANSFLYKLDVMAGSDLVNVYMGKKKVNVVIRIV